MSLILSITLFVWIFITSFLIIYLAKGDLKKFIILVVHTIITIIVLIYIGQYSGTVETLRGHPNYEMKIKYELKDSIFIPCDTIYVLK